MKIEYATLAQFVRDNADAQQIVNWPNDDATDDDPIDNIRHFALSHTDALSRYMRVWCSFDVRADNIECDPMLFYAVERISGAITHEYDHVEKYDHTDVINVVKLWDVFGLGGDDDVDYNGSYISITVDLLRAYCKANNIETY